MAFSPREIRAAGLHAVAGWRLKAYELVAAGQRIEPETRAAAWAMVPDLLAEPVDATPRAGWVVIHRGSDGAYLVVNCWVWGEVLETNSAVAGNPALGAGGAELSEFGLLPHRWVGCVWELAPFAHEREAWIRHVLRPGEPDLDGYLSDTFPDGPTDLADPRVARVAGPADLSSPASSGA